MKRFLILLMLALTGLAAAAPKMETHSWASKGAKLTVVHTGAPWWGSCVAMEPAVTQFESKYKGKINYVFLNVDQTGTREYKKWGHLVKLVKEEVPYTFWLDSKGKVLEKKNEETNTLEELSAVTNKFVKK